LARYLALDWDHNQLHVVAATISGGTVRIQRAAVWQEAQTPNPAEAEALGKRLRERLRDAGIAPAPVLACVGRDRVILKELRYPAVPPAQEPALVRFQAVKELTEPPDEVIIDYTPLETSPNGERRALAPIIRKEMLQAYQTLCQAAGVKLAALTPRPFGTAACLERHTEPAAAIASAPLPGGDPAQDTVAVLTVADHWAEFCVLRGKTLAFARSVAVGPTLAGEVRRSLIVYAGQAPQHPVRAVYVAGTADRDDLRARLTDLLDLPVYAFDPFARVERPELPTAGRGAFSGCVGLLHAQADKAGLPVNFINIKQPQAERDPNQRRYLAAAALILVLLLGGVLWCHNRLAAADAELASLNDAGTRLDTQLTPIEEEAKFLKAVGDWNDGGLVWLDEIYDVTERFPREPNLRLTELECTTRPATAKDKHVGILALNGITTDDDLAKQLVDRLDEASRYYRIPLPDLQPNNTGLEFRQFRRKFILRVDVEKRPPTEYKLTLASSDTSRGDRRRNPRRGNGRGGRPNFGNFGGFGGN
jgi:Tfp pilus assembly PilM family ATPase